MIAAVCGAALFIIMFLAWFGVGGVPDGAEEAAEQLGVDVPDLNFNAWESFDIIDLVLLVTVIVAVGAGIAAAMARDVALPVAASALVAGLGILSTLLILYRIIDPPGGADREFGVFLGLIAAAGIAYGGWVGMQEEGTSFGDQVDRFQGDDRTPPPPPAAPPPAQGGPPPQGPAA